MEPSDRHAQSPNACCAPRRERDGRVLPDADAAVGQRHPRPSTAAWTLDTIRLEGGAFIMGESGPMAYPADGEEPRPATVAPFAIAATAVTNAEFGAFVDATGYITEAERFEWSFVFAGLLPGDFEDTRGVAAAPWWRQVFGARWDRPEGRDSTIDARMDHPVVHVSWNDAQSYARWVDARLPSEPEWEFAARAGSASTFPWGDDLEPDGRHVMNVFQGEFPGKNTGADGWLGTCPVTAYEPNRFGIHNMIGNVWEWTGGAFSAARSTEFALKGGSYLCHASYCHRYRPAARMGSTPDSSTGNIGFRLAG